MHNTNELLTELQNDARLVLQNCERREATLTPGTEQYKANHAIKAATHRQASAAFVAQNLLRQDKPIADIEALLVTYIKQMGQALKHYHNTYTNKEFML